MTTRITKKSTTDEAPAEAAPKRVIVQKSTTAEAPDEAAPKRVIVRKSTTTDEPQDDDLMKQLQGIMARLSPTQLAQFTGSKAKDCNAVVPRKARSDLTNDIDNDEEDSRQCCWPFVRGSNAGSYCRKRIYIDGDLMCPSHRDAITGKKLIAQYEAGLAVPFKYVWKDSKKKNSPVGVINPLRPGSSSEVQNLISIKSNSDKYKNNLLIWKTKCLVIKIEGKIVTVQGTLVGMDTKRLVPAVRDTMESVFADYVDCTIKLAENVVYTDPKQPVTQWEKAQSPPVVESKTANKITRPLKAATKADSSDDEQSDDEPAKKQPVKKPATTTIVIKKSVKKPIVVAEEEVETVARDPPKVVVAARKNSNNSPKPEPQAEEDNKKSSKVTRKVESVESEESEEEDEPLEEEEEQEEEEAEAQETDRAAPPSDSEDEDPAVGIAIKKPVPSNNNSDVDSDDAEP